MENAQRIIAQREQLQKKYAASRSNLLLALVLTVINIVLLFTESNSMLLFSMSVPYYTVAFSRLLDLETVGLIIAAVMLAVYLLCWILSKKRCGWLVASAVLFVIDSLCLAGLYILMQDFSGILDAVIHIAVLYYLFSGISAYNRLKKLPQLTPEQESQALELPDYSTPIRRADEDVKHRVLLECEYGGHRVCYRRVKRVNELVIDGNVYDEYTAMIESPHKLVARIAGHTYEVGTNQQNRSYFQVDGEQIESKIRLV